MNIYQVLARMPRNMHMKIKSYLIIEFFVAQNSTLEQRLFNDHAKNN